MSCTLKPVIQSGDTGQRIPFLMAVNVHKDFHYQVKHMRAIYTRKNKTRLK